MAADGEVLDYGLFSNKDGSIIDLVVFLGDDGVAHGWGDIVFYPSASQEVEPSPNSEIIELFENGMPNSGTFWLDGSYRVCAGHKVDAFDEIAGEVEILGAPPIGEICGAIAA
jgi:hypothetical protein